MSVETFKAVEDQVEEEVHVEQRPSVGRNVHYSHPNGRDVHHANIARVFGDAVVNLGCIDHNGVAYPATSVPFDPSGKPGTWRWPPRV